MTELVVSTGTDAQKLPSIWVNTTLSEIGHIASGGTPKTKDSRNFDGDIPWVTPADLSGYKKKTISSGKRNISQQGLDTSSARLLPPRTVLFSSRAPVGYVAIAEAPVSTNQGFKSLIPDQGIYSDYVYHYLKANKSLAESYAGGTTFRELSARAFGSLPITLPPLNEQRRIVEKIEELFTRLDAGVEALKHAQAQLKTYRQSLLNAAVTGELSREWREAHADEVEPASELLERILEERRERFAGKKYKEPVEPNIKRLSEVPKRWVWSTTDQLLNFVTSGSRGWAKYYSKEGPMFLRVGNLDHDAVSLDLQDVQRVQPPLGSEGSRTLVTEDDIVISITADVGMVAIVPKSFEEAYVNQHIALIRPSKEIDVGYLAWFLVSESGNKQLTGRQYGATKPGLNLEDIRTVNVPLPPLDEQRFIVSEVERRFSVMDQLESTIEESLKRSESLRQSILKRAFSGELVEQDPEDEPASVLLERIREERQASEKKGKNGKARREGDSAEQVGLFDADR